MKLRDLIEALNEPDIFDPEDVSNDENFLDREVRFNTSDREKLHLLGVYEAADGVIEIDIGADGE
jgi:hypothetical protein